MYTTRILILAIVSLVSAAYSQLNDIPEANMDSRADEPNIVEMFIYRILENVRVNPAIYPSLDFEGKSREIGEGGTSLNLSFRNVEIIGIPEFRPLVHFNFTTTTTGVLELELEFDEIIITGENYGIKGIVANVLNMNADGPFELRIGNVLLEAFADVTDITVIPSPSAVLRNLEISLTCETFQMEMVNFFGPGNLTDEFNKMMNVIGHDVMYLYKEPIDTIAARYFEKLLNDLLSPGKKEADYIQHLQMEADALLDDFVRDVIKITKQPSDEYYSIF